MPNEEECPKLAELLGITSHILVIRPMLEPNLAYGCNIYGDLHVLEFKMSHTMVKGRLRSIF